jgi:hypothetical protein
MSGLEGSYISGVAGSPVDIGRLDVGSSNIAKPILEGVLWRVEFLSRTYRMRRRKNIVVSIILTWANARSRVKPASVRGHGKAKFDAECLRTTRHLGAKGRLFAEPLTLVNLKPPERCQGGSSEVGDERVHVCPRSPQDRMLMSSGSCSCWWRTDPMPRPAMGWRATYHHHYGLFPTVDFTEPR